LGHLLHRLEDRQQAVRTQHRDLLVVADEGAGAVGRREGVGADEALRQSTPSSPSTVGAMSIWLIMVSNLRGDVTLGPDEERDLVFAHLEFALAGDGGAVVGHDDEDRVLEPGASPARP
jgi:hypothetical protein